MLSKFLTIPEVTMANGRAANHIWRTDEEEEEQRGGKGCAHCHTALIPSTKHSMGENMRIDRNNGADDPTYG
jgi:hypothetical protein